MIALVFIHMNVTFSPGQSIKNTDPSAPSPAESEISGGEALESPSEQVARWKRLPQITGQLPGSLSILWPGDVQGRRQVPLAQSKQS